MKELDWRDEHPQYTQLSLNDVVVKNYTNPWMLWLKWQDEAKRTERYTNEVALSTASLSGEVGVRMVLLKICSEERGFCWYSKIGSEKGRHVSQNPRAEILWYNKHLHQQVRIRGPVILLPAEETRVYAQSRPKQSQISALISQQSEEIESRAVLEKKHRDAEKKYKDKDVPIPEDWYGYSLQPLRFEFWQGRLDRLHDRIVYSRGAQGWDIKRLQP